MTFAQAQERAERWVNGEVPAELQREVRVREFALGFVAWAEDREGGPAGEGSRSRLVIARDSGETTLWPGLPVGEVIRRYEEEYSAPVDGGHAAAESPQRIDLEATSFLLTPPEWLQEAADAIGIGGRKDGGAGVGAGAGAASGSGAGSASGSAGGAASGSGDGGASGGAAESEASGGAAGPESQAGAEPIPASTEEAAGAAGAEGVVPGPASADAWADVSVNAEPDAAHPTPTPAPTSPSPSPASSSSASADDTPWAAADTTAGGHGEDLSVAPPQTVFAPPLAGADDEDAPSQPRVRPDAKTELLRRGDQLPRRADPSATPPMPPAPDGAAPGHSGAGASGGLPPAAPMPPAPPGVPQPPPVPSTPSTAPANLRDLPPPVGAPVADVPPPPEAMPPLPPSQGGLGGGAHAAPPMSADGSALPGNAGGPTPPPGVPGIPGPGPDGGRPGPEAGGKPAGGYVPTQLVSQLDAPDLDLSAMDGPGTGPGKGPDGGPANGGGAGGAAGTEGSAAEGSDVSGTDGSGTDGSGTAASGGGAAGSGTGRGVHAAATMLADGASLQAPVPGPGGATGGPGGPGMPPPPPGPLGGAGPQGGPQCGPQGAAGRAGMAAGGQGGQGGPPPPPPPVPAPPNGSGAGGGVHAAATMLASGPALSGGPGGPQGAGPGGPGTPPAAGPGVPPGPPMAPPAQPGPQSGPQPGPQPGPQSGPPGVPGPGLPGPGGPGPGGPGAGAQGAGAAPGAYGYPQAPSGQPTVGPGYMAVLSYRAPDGSEQKIVRRSAPGTPHPEWQLLHELRAMNVPPQQVVELHTELECCDLPGGYCARMVRETWPQVRISHTAAYGKDHASRQQGVRHLIEHQGELHQVADGPARPAPVRAPLPHPSQVQPVPPVPPQAIGHELEQSFGPQAIFRFDQRAVSRQGVPDVVAQTLVWAGLPVDFGPFFWAQAQPGRPVPTLAELAAERMVQPAADAGSYLVMGNDFGRQLCVQYGTANIVAVPLEAGPGGQPVAPQFVNTGLPEFVRCLAMLGRMWRLRFGLTPEQAGRWTVDFQAQLVALDPPALGSSETWWSVLLEQMWDGLL
ncbi:SUKH-4 family immunity protein [Streptomyces sp. NPDC093707]|uniref:SUKH-4 family immunity protein n=1 Tax=Streptomyces sp. NPDC093707 TaxID=3154984 RepID=UPI00344F1F4F